MSRSSSRTAVDIAEPIGASDKLRAAIANHRTPKSSGVVLGLLSSSVPTFEDLDLLNRRVDEAARFTDLGCLAVSPQ